MTTATATDYGWIRSPSSPFRYALECGYSLTLVRDTTPDELFRVAEAEQTGSCRGLAELVERSQEFLYECADWPESFIAGAFVVRGRGADWTLALEFGGDLGTRPELLEALSAGTRAVSHSSNGGKPMHFFNWYEDGSLRTTFESAAFRTGSTPDELNALLREVGLNPDGDPDPLLDRKAAVFALTERLTGVRVTEALLTGAEFRTAEVPEAPVPE
ncbi:DUF6461 domain-containing protein [Streptomyces fructofermentans]|uniref:DUF6461 domain-containing protein n=1 Tax=Streptomyces fructofermentans TaxID=152141 RepID=UPI0033E24CCE